jgi:Precorrin-6x reductase
MNVLVMAGTSDARKIITDLSMGKGIKVLATATTPHGVDLAKTSGASKVLEGFFDSEKLTNILRDNDIKLLIDATHPFASAATQNAIKASDVVGVDYIRFERPATIIPDSQLIHQVNSFEDAAVVIREIINQNDFLVEENPSRVKIPPTGMNSSTGKNPSMAKFTSKGKVLHLAGVNTLHHLTDIISPDLIVARVLPTVYSVKKSLELDIPHVNILAMEGTFSPRFNGILMEEFQIKVVLTKESGEAGAPSPRSRRH